MALLDFFRSKEEAPVIVEKEMTPSQAVSDYGTAFSVGVTAPKITREALNSNIGWVYACVDALASEVAKIELKLVRVKKNGEIEEIFEHPILEVLAKANRLMTKFDFFYLTQTYLELAGEAPWYVSLLNGKPNELFLLRPDRFDVIPANNGKDIIAGYNYRVADQSGGVSDVKLTPFEVVFNRYPDPTKPFRGVGTLAAVARTVDIDFASEEYNKNFFNNAATPSAVLSTDQKLANEVREKLRREMREKYEGVTNAHKTLILEGGLEYTAMALSQKEMDYIESMRFNRDKILAIFRVPRTVLGITDDVNRANAEATDYVFSKRAIQPRMQRLVEMLNEFFVPMFGVTDLVLTYEDPVPENTEQNVRLAESGLTNRYITPNEARELLGYDAIEGGDEIREPINPFGDVEPNDEKKLVAKRRKQKIKGSAYSSLRKKTKEVREWKQLQKQVEKQIRANVTPMFESMIHEKIKEKKAKQKSQPFKGTEEEVKSQKYAFQAVQLRVGEEHENKFKSKMNGLFEEQKQSVNSKLKGRRSFADVQIKALTDEVFDEEAWTEATGSKLKPAFVSTIADQSRQAFRLLGQDNVLTERNGEVAKYLESHVPDLSGSVTKTTKEAIAKALSEGVQRGESIPQLQSRITEVFETAKGYRSSLIARTEVINATSFATEQSYIESKVVDAKEWLTFRDERTDEDCEALDGEIAQLGKNFRGGVDSPPLHPNCRCTLIPVVSI